LGFGGGDRAATAFAPREPLVICGALGGAYCMGLPAICPARVLQVHRGEFNENGHPWTAVMILISI